MHRPRFSVVIPTREGGETLPFTLRTCLVQAHPDFEIVVADNASGPAVRAAVEACADERIHYTRSNTPLAMTDSWESAVAQAAGEYVIVLGDDDALLPHALAEIDRILTLTQAVALRWECGLYFWPGVDNVPGWQANALALPLNQVACGHAVHQYRADTLIQDAANSRIGYVNLPLIYCGAIHRDLIAAARARTGRVFHSRYPDVYSAFAFAHLAGTYHSADAPMCLRGTSKKSTGLAYFLARESRIAQEFHALNRAAKYDRSADIPDLPLMPAVVADGYEHARVRLFPEAPPIDRKLLLQNCLQAREREAAVQDRDQPRPDGWLYLDGADLGASDIAEAAQVCENLLRFTRNDCRSWLADPVPRTVWVDPGLPGQLREFAAAHTATTAALEQATRQSPQAPRPLWRRTLGTCWRWLSQRRPAPTEAAS